MATERERISIDELFVYKGGFSPESLKNMRTILRIGSENKPDYLCKEEILRLANNLWNSNAISVEEIENEVGALLKSKIYKGECAVHKEVWTVWDEGEEKHICGFCQNKDGGLNVFTEELPSGSINRPR